MWLATVLLLGMSPAPAGPVFTACPRGVECSTRSRRAVGSVTLSEVRGEIDGIPLAQPIARRLVDTDGRQIGPTVGAVLRSDPGPLPEATVEAVEAVRAAVSQTGFAVESATLVAQRRGGALHPVWRIDPYPDPRTLAHPLIFVDAVTGEVRLGPDRTLAARAHAFARNPVLDQDVTRYELAFVDDGAQALIGPLFHGTNCVPPAAGALCDLGDVAPGPNGDWFPAVPDIGDEADNVDPDDAFSAVSVFTFADRFAQYAAEHELGNIPCQPATLVANYRAFTEDGGYIPVGNAVYTGDCSFTAAFGQGRAADWGYDGDVVYHELAHGLIERLMGEGRFLGFTRHREDGVLTDAGALNEAIADFTAAVISGDPGHAEYASEIGTASGRDAANDLRCPEGLVGEIHFDSEIMAGALWRAYEELGDDLLRAVLLSVALLEEDATFEEASVTFVEVTRDLLGAAAGRVLRDALAARGLDDCPRVAPWHRITGPIWIHPRTTYDPLRPPAVQLAFTLPPDKQRLVVRYDLEILAPQMWAPDALLNALVKVGEPLKFSYGLIDETENVLAEPDEHLADVNGGRFEVTAAPGSTVYVAFFNQHVTTVLIHDVQATFRDRVEPDPDPEPQTGPEPDPESESGEAGAADEVSTTVDAQGCGCRSGDPWPGPGGSGGLLLVFGLAAMRRRPARAVEQ